MKHKTAFLEKEKKMVHDLLSNVNLDSRKFLPPPLLPPLMCLINTFQFALALNSQLKVYTAYCSLNVLLFSGFFFKVENENDFLVGM